MNRKTIALLAGGIIILLGIYFLTTYSAPASTKITNYPSQGKNIIAFGDSLVAGNGSTEGHDLISDLSHEIGQPIINDGVSGETTAQAMARLDTVLTNNPKLVIILLGGNDFLQKVPTKTTFSNLETMIYEIENKGAEVLLLGVRGGFLTDPTSSYYKALALKYHTGYVPDVLSGLIGHTEYMSDEVHPNDTGYKKISDRVYPVLKLMLSM